MRRAARLRAAGPAPEPGGRAYSTAPHHLRPGYRAQLDGNQHTHTIGLLRRRHGRSPGLEPCPVASRDPGRHESASHVGHGPDRTLGPERERRHERRRLDVSRRERHAHGEHGPSGHSGQRSGVERDGQGSVARHVLERAGPELRTVHGGLSVQRLQLVHARLLQHDERRGGVVPSPGATANRCRFRTRVGSNANPDYINLLGTSTSPSRAGSTREGASVISRNLPRGRQQDFSQIVVQLRGAVPTLQLAHRSRRIRHHPRRRSTCQRRR